jgi:hypothetical protein
MTIRQQSGFVRRFDAGFRTDALDMNNGWPGIRHPTASASLPYVDNHANSEEEKINANRTGLVTSSSPITLLF